MRVFADIFLGFCFLFLCYLSLASGEVFYTFSELIGVLSADPDSLIHTIITEIRLPRMLSVLLVGGSLSICGLYFQNLLKNALAEPFTMGFSGAAALGVSLSIALGFYSDSFGPSLLGLLACGFVAWFSIQIKQKYLLKSHVGLILIGLSIGFFCSALVVLLQGSFKPDDLHQSYQWLIGSFDTFRTKNWPLLLGPLLLLIVFQLLKNNELNKCLIGESTAKSLGINKGKLETYVLMLAALVCGFSVYISGVIAFVGLVGPHIAKRIYETKLHHKLFLRSFLVGANLLLLSDVIAINISRNIVVPTGGVVSLIGAPFLVFLLLKEKQYA